MRVLVVKDPFGPYDAGDMITDASIMRALEENGNVSRCTPTDIEDTFFAAPDQSAKAKA